MRIARPLRQVRRHGLGWQLGLVALGLGCATMSAAPPKKLDSDTAGEAMSSDASSAPTVHTGSAPVLLFPAVNVLDLEATEAFYVGLMGMKVTLRIGDAKSDRQEVTLNFSGEMGAPEASLVLDHVVDRREPYAFQGLSRIAFRVPDVDALVEKIRAAGHPVLSETRLIEVNDSGIKVAFVEDPNGTRVELIQLLD